jgi:hypothetical protein
MNNISNIDQLKLAIAALETKRTDQGQVVKEQFLNIQEQLQPVNMLKNTVKDFIASNELKNGIIDVSMGAAAGFLVRKIFNGESKNIFQKLLTVATESFVSTEVARKGDQLRSWLSSLVKK